MSTQGTVAVVLSTDAFHVPAGTSNVGLARPTVATTRAAPDAARRTMGVPAATSGHGTTGLSVESKYGVPGTRTAPHASNTGRPLLRVRASTPSAPGAGTNTKYTSASPPCHTWKMSLSALRWKNPMGEASASVYAILDAAGRAAAPQNAGSCVTGWDRYRSFQNPPSGCGSPVHACTNAFCTPSPVREKTRRTTSAGCVNVVPSSASIFELSMSHSNPLSYGSDSDFRSTGL